MSEFLAICEQAAREGGAVLREMQGKASAKAKGPKDFVTQADLASERVIREVVLAKFPSHAFLGEESAFAEGDNCKMRLDELFRPGEVSAHPYCWVVDPLDGTMNYVHRLQTYAVSVALMFRGAPIAACVYDPVVDECYSAASGEGAWLNGERLAVSRCTLLENALVAASFAPVLPRGSLEIARFVEVLHQSQSVRRLGSAALNLAYVAAGRLDAYWATSVNSWDIAAGVLLVSEAGGVVTELASGRVDWRQPKFCASATGELHRELLDVLASVER